MQKRESILKNNKGIALITLIVAVLMMLVISSIIIYNSTSHYKMSNLNNMYNDIKLLNDQVFLYYSKNNQLPIIYEDYNWVLNSNITGEYSLEYFRIIDIDQMNKNIKSNLNYGDDYYSKKYEEENYQAEDIYIINTLTHQIFYVKGIQVEGITYYTIPGENQYTPSQINNLIANPPILENDLSPIIFSENKVIEINKYDQNWYDYSEEISKWARARGESDEDLYMWVPRYAYNTETNEIVFLKGKTNNPIDTTKDISGNDWVIPGAFQNREKGQLSGIWLSIDEDYKKIKTIEDLINAINELAENDDPIVDLPEEQEEPEAGEVKIVCKIEETGEKLLGATIKIYSNKELTNSVKEINFSTKSYIIIDDLEEGEYYVVCNSVPYGYVLAADYVCYTVGKEDNNIWELKFNKIEDELTRFKITNYDVDEMLGYGGYGDVVLNVLDEGTAIEGMQFNLYIIGEPKNFWGLEGWKPFGYFAWLDDIYPHRLSSSTLNKMASNLENYAETYQYTPDMTAYTDNSGRVEFANIPEGLYLVTSKIIKIGNNTYYIKPFIFAVSNFWSENEREYVDVITIPVEKI